MSRANIYIRKENEKIWNDLAYKSDWLNKQLSKLRDQEKHKNNKDEFFKDKTSSFCKNNHPIPEGQSKCLGKGCKYS